MWRFLVVFALAGCGGNMMPGGDAGSDGGGSTPDLTSAGDMAKAAGAETGAPCAMPSDCAGSKPQCVKKDAMMVVWPAGYCSAGCNENANDPNDGTNPACPGTGTCVGTNCFATCDAGTCRTDYACFNFASVPICWPLSASECNPMKMDCLQDGGTLDDAGVYYGFNCTQYGPDPVGICEAACDVFVQNCDTANGDACVADPDTGLAACSSSSGGLDGTACVYLNDCDVGLACSDEAGMSICRAYCGGKNNVACPMGQTCKDLSMTVTKDKLGICSK